MSWRDFKTSPPVQKVQNIQKPLAPPPFVPSVPFVDRGEDSKAPLPYGVTLAEVESAFGHDPDWPKVKDDPHCLHNLAEALSPRGETERAGPREAKQPAQKGAHQLTPTERSIWCMSHESTLPGGRCTNKNRLDGCQLWEAVRRKALLTPPV